MDNLFFYASKILWILFSPYSLFVILLASCTLLLLFNYTRAARFLLVLLTLGVVTLSFFSFGNLMMHPLESRFQHNPALPQQVDGIIVLGGSVIPSLSTEWQQLETNTAAERLYSFIELAHRYPQAKLVFSGGNASFKPDQATESHVVREYFLRAGIEQERLILETSSRNTAENAYFTKQMVNPRANENWVLITTAYHMPRSVGLFCKQGWSVIAYPVDHYSLPSELYEVRFSLSDHANNLQLATHEWIGLFAYYLTGKIDSVLPMGCAQPAA